MDVRQFQRRLLDCPVKRDADHVAITLPYDMLGASAMHMRAAGHRRPTDRGLVLGYKKETLGEMAVEALVSPNVTPTLMKKIALFKHMLGDEWPVIERMAEMVKIGHRSGGPGISAAELQTGVIIDGPTI